MAGGSCVGWCKYRLLPPSERVLLDSLALNIIENESKQTSFIFTSKEFWATGLININMGATSFSIIAAHTA